MSNRRGVTIKHIRYIMNLEQCDKVTASDMNEIVIFHYDEGKFIFLLIESL